VAHTELLRITRLRITRLRITRLRITRLRITRLPRITQLRITRLPRITEIRTLMQFSRTKVTLGTRLALHTKPVLRTNLQRKSVDPVGRTGKLASSEQILGTKKSYTHVRIILRAFVSLLMRHSLLRAIPSMV